MPAASQASPTGLDHIGETNEKVGGISRTPLASSPGSASEGQTFAPEPPANKTGRTMPQPALRESVAREAIEAVEQMLREGYRPRGLGGTGPAAIAAAADMLGVNRATFQNRIVLAEKLFGLVPDDSHYRPRQYLHRPPGAPVIPFQDHIKEPMPEGRPVKICVIGDAHDSPHLADKSRFYWLGRFAADNAVDRVVSVGDWMTLDCFSTHTDRATFEGLSKPTFSQDLASFHESQREFRRGLGALKPKLDITLGNHEHRAWRWDNFHPEAEPHGLKIEEAFAQWGWRTTPYGQYRFIEGVGFTHVPLNAIGKPMGGVTGGQRAANAAMYDIVHGDTHRSQTSVADKLGPIRAPTVFNAATALPNGFIEGFANKGASAWRSGACLAIVWGGYVRSWTFSEMCMLEWWYGEKAAA